MTSYRLFLVRSALARFGRALAFYWLTLRGALRSLWASYRCTLVRYRVRSAASATGRALVRLPRRARSVLGLIAWFLGRLPSYVRRVLEERREDRTELRAERRLLAAARRAQRAERREVRQARAAERRARRRAEQAEIKAAREQRPQHLPVPAWISRMEQSERPAGAARRLPAPRLAMVAAAITLAAAVPTYAIVTGAIGSEPTRATPQVAGSSGPVVADPASPAVGPGQPVAPPVVPTPVAPAIPTAGPTAGPAVPGPVTGDTAEFVRTLPPLPTAAPTVPAPSLRVSAAGPGGAPAGAPAGPPAAGEAPVVGSLSTPLSEHQQREVRRQAKREAQQEAQQQRAEQQRAKADLGK